MLRSSTSALDTALPEHATVSNAATLHEPAQQPTPIHAHAAPLHEFTDVEITALSATEWRVADHAIEHDDPAALLGFIQVVGSAYEVTNLGRPRERAYFSSFDRATASLTRGVFA